MRGSYAIREDYQHRINNNFFDDTHLKDEWQREVYQLARKLAGQSRASKVLDVGCGSAFKLLKYLGHLHTIGLDLEPTLGFLHKTYPEKDWRLSDFSSKIERVDLVICSDVVEHIADPDLLMDFLQQIPSPIYVISTPEREAVYGFDQSGPPSNTAHCREWTSSEFCAYVSRWFDVREALISNREQGTQVVVCVPRTGPTHLHSSLSDDDEKISHRGHAGTKMSTGPGSISDQLVKWSGGIANEIDFWTDWIRTGVAAGRILERRFHYVRQ